MQRLEAKKPPERPLFTAETRNAQNRQQDPRRNGLLLIDDGFYRSGRLDGGGRSPAKPVSKRIPLPAAKNTGNFANFRPSAARKTMKTPVAQVFLSLSRAHFAGNAIAECREIRLKISINLHLEDARIVITSVT